MKTPPQPDTRSPVNHLGVRLTRSASYNTGHPGRSECQADSEDVFGGSIPAAARPQQKAEDPGADSECPWAQLAAPHAQRLPRGQQGAAGLLDV